MNMHPEQKSFLDALADNEDDDMTRLVYSDWLDEHDMPEEADRMRRWRASKDWLMKLAFEEIGNHFGHDRAEQSYQELIRQIIKQWNDKYITITGTSHFRDLMRSDEKEEFWDHIGVVTGLSTQKVRSTPFCCSC